MVNRHIDILLNSPAVVGQSLTTTHRFQQTATDISMWCTDRQLQRRSIVCIVGMALMSGPGEQW